MFPSDLAGAEPLNPRSATDRLTVGVVQVAIPEYRVDLFAALRQRLPNLTLLTGDEYFEPSVVSAEAGRAGAVGVTNRYLLRRTLLWQCLPWRRLLALDVVVVELNPRTLSTWVLLALRKLSRRRSLVWGHAWSRRGPSAASNHLRGAMLRLCSGAVAYSENDAAGLRSRYPWLAVAAAPNATFRTSELPIPSSTADPGHTILVVGRLVAEKQPLMALSAFEYAETDAKLVFVGDGPLRPRLDEEVKRRNLQERVCVLGAITDPATLRRLYAASFVSVLPGTAGLSLIQSLYFGVPAAVYRSARHGPELEALCPGVNGSTFEDQTSLQVQLHGYWVDREYWATQRAAIARRVRATHSVDRMVEVLVTVITAA